MANINDLPPEILRIILRCLNRIYTTPSTNTEHLLSDILERFTPERAAGSMYANRMDFDFSIFVAMTVCRNWRATIDDLVIRNGTTTKDQVRTRYKNLTAAFEMVKWLGILDGRKYQFPTNFGASVGRID